MQPSRIAVNEADPRVKRTRKLLQDALVELLSEKPFDAITVQDIATRSTVNRATFYAHFVDKHDLFAQFSGEWFRGVVEQQLAGASELSTENVRTLALATMQALADLHDHCRPTEALKPLIMAAVQEELAGILRSWLAPSAQRLDLDAAVAALSWAIFGAALQWSQSARTTPAESTAQQLAALLTQGFPPADPLTQTLSPMGERVRASASG